MGWKSRLPLGLAIAFIVVAPAIFGSFTITLMNYIGIYALTGLVATILGAATLRLGGHFLPLSTIAWGVAIFFLFGNIDAIGRYSGLSGIPAITIGPLSLGGNTAMYCFIWGLLGFVMLLCRNLLDSRKGRAIRGLRGGIAMVESLAIDFFRMRLAVFVLAGMLAGLSGWLYAHMQRYVSPAPFDIRPSIELLLMALVGGAGHIAGAVVGAAAITLLKNALQDVLPLFTRYSAQLEVVAFGVLFVVILQKARAGIVPMIARYLPRPRLVVPGQVPPLARRGRPVVSGQAVLTIQGATKRFGALAAVNDVSFEVKGGEVLGLIGPNGAGKSTLLNLITGTAKPNSGRIMFLDDDVTKLAPRDIAGKGVARTFQHVKLRPNMTLLDNTLLGTYSRTRSGFLAGAIRLDREEEKSAQCEALQQLKRVGLAEKAGELAGSLPLGQQRLLEVARALAADPVLVILDEPAAGLRSLEKQILSRLLRTLRNEGMTIVLVEHDMEFVMNLVDRIVVMDFGSKLAEGVPAAIRAEPRVQEAYLGGVA